MELLLRVTLSCKILSSFCTFLILLLILHYHLLLCLSFICFTTPSLLLSSLPVLSACLDLLLELYPRHDGMDVGT